MEKFCKMLTKEILRKDLKDKKKILELRDNLAKKYKPRKIPSLVEILINSPANKIPLLKKRLLSKPTRTLSGVTPIAIMTKPLPCPHGKCAYCPGGPKSCFGDVPQSYIGKEPATMRAIRNMYDPYLQIFNRLEQYTVMGHPIEKVELIIMGGTFPSFPEDYQEEFIKYSFKALNDFSKLFFKNNELDYLKFKEFFGFPTDNFESKERINKIYEAFKKATDENKKQITDYLLTVEQKLTLLSPEEMWKDTQAQYATLKKLVGEMGLLADQHK